MKKIVAVLLLSLVVSNAIADELESGSSGENGVVTFDVKPLAIPHSKYQAVSLFGCNHVLETVDKLEWGGIYSQSLPYGWRQDGDKSFFVAQYYLASPPVPADPAAGETTTLGLLHPDHFKFKGLNPTQKVVLDYNVLKPMYLSYVNIDYGSCDGKVDMVPINTVCPKFPYKNGERGLASGIGVLANKEGQRRIFLPTEDKDGKKPLQCSVSLLNDIQLEYEIRFSIGEVISDQLNLTQQFKSQPGPGVALVCRKKPADAPLPSGCAPTQEKADYKQQ